MIATHRDAGGVNLRVTGVGKSCSTLVGSVSRSDIATHGVSGKVEDVSVTTSRQHNRVG